MLGWAAADWNFKNFAKLKNFGLGSLANLVVPRDHNFGAEEVSEARQRDQVAHNFQEDHEYRPDEIVAVARPDPHLFQGAHVLKNIEEEPDHNATASQLDDFLRELAQGR